MPHRAKRYRRQNRSRPADLLEILGPLALGGLAIAFLKDLTSKPSPPPQPKYIGVPRDVFDYVRSEQQQDMWCWAACVEMVIRFYGIAVEQRQIVRRVYGVPANQPADDRTISASLNGWGFDMQHRRVSVRSSVLSGTPAPWILLRELAKGCPILLTFNPGVAVGHAVVVTGASVINGDIASLVYRDPSPHETSAGQKGRVELFGEDLGHFLACVRNYWLVSARLV